MKSITATSTLLISIFWCGMASAGPFGLEMGMSLKQIDAKAKQIAPGKYEITTVPEPHSAFESYVVQVTPKTGLCYIKAIGKDLSTSSYGIELKSAFYAMNEKLEAAYGKGETTDALLPGSIWDEPNDWMMGLIKKERFLYSIWQNKSGENIKRNIKNIVMAAKPSGGSKGYLIIDYAFDNEDTCDKEISSQEDSAL